MEQGTKLEAPLSRAQAPESRIPIDSASHSGLDKPRFADNSSHQISGYSAAGYDLPYLYVDGGEYLPEQVDLRSAWRSAVKALLKLGNPTLAVCYRDPTGPVYALLELTGPQRVRISIESQHWCDESALTAFIAFHGLTPRESEVFRALCEGLKTKAIARESNCQPSTIKCHIKSILTKTNERTMNDVLLRLARVSRKQLAHSVETNIR
ncbi:MAG: response regulator transcription factor [Burkholderiaceae bacterium]